MDIDLSGFNSAQEKVAKKGTEVKANKPPDRIEAQDKYVDAQDAAVKAYTDAWAKLEKAADPGAAADRMFDAMNSIGKTEFYALSAKVGENGITQPQITLPDFNKEVRKWPVEKLVAAETAMKDLEKKLNQTTSEITSDMDKAEKMMRIHAAKEASKAEDSTKAERLIADLNAPGGDRADN